MCGPQGPLIPTYQNCFVQGPEDALILVQAVIDGLIVAVDRRPQDQERNRLIRSGNVFIFHDANGSIQRWTDGIPWSPSRILGDFLIYREKKFPQRVSQRSSSDSKVNLSSRGSVSKKPHNRHHHQHSSGSIISSSSIAPYGGLSDDDYPSSPVTTRQSAEYSLYGSLTNSDHYKENGLIKKTISIPYEGSSYRLVSYYLPEDVETGALIVPSNDPKFKDVVCDPNLAEKKHMKLSVHISQADLMNPRPMTQSHPYGAYDAYGGYGGYAAPVYSQPAAHGIYDSSYMAYPLSAPPMSVPHSATSESSEGYPYNAYDPRQHLRSESVPETATNDISAYSYYHQEVDDQGPYRNDNRVSMLPNIYATDSLSNTFRQWEFSGSNPLAPAPIYQAYQTEKPCGYNSANQPMSISEMKKEEADTTADSIGVNIFSEMVSSHGESSNSIVHPSGNIPASVISQDSDEYDAQYSSASSPSSSHTNDATNNSKSYLGSTTADGHTSSIGPMRPQTQQMYVPPGATGAH